jgi:sec-independent protein translocase protein TatC
MASSRRYVLFGIVVVAAVLTPPDVLSQMLLAVPMYLLFEIGIRLAKTRKSSNTTID